jgi:hypothetical protein
VLERVNRVTGKWRGRTERHYLNPVPIPSKSPTTGSASSNVHGEKRSPIGNHNGKKGVTMSNSKFVYVIYIRTTAENLWDALTKPEFTRAYWVGCSQESAWKKGASWVGTLTRCGKGGGSTESPLGKETLHTRLVFGLPACGHQRGAGRTEWLLLLNNSARDPVLYVRNMIVVLS